MKPDTRMKCRPDSDIHNSPIPPPFFSSPAKLVTSLYFRTFALSVAIGNRITHGVVKEVDELIRSGSQIQFFGLRVAAVAHSI